MTNVSFPKVEAAAQGAGLRLAKLDGGTIRVELESGYLLAPVTPSQLHWKRGRKGDKSQVYYLIGREVTPPLKGLVQDAGPLALFADRRIVSTRDVDEVARAIETSAEKGNSVDNDFYVFGDLGGWLLYASHHREVLMYIALSASTRRAPRDRSPAKPPPTQRRKQLQRKR